jgi:transposase
VRDIATLRGLGYSYREIASHLRVSPQAVSIMLARHRRKLRTLANAPSMHRLSARAVNALGRHGIADRKQAREAGVLALLAREPNCGRKTLEEIAMWMERGD